MLALTSSPALLSSLTVLGEEEEEEETFGHLHTLISEPVKPEWGVHAAAAEHLQPQLTSSVLFIQFFFFVPLPPKQINTRAYAAQRERCNSVRCVQAIYFYRFHAFFST